ncbi:hypothetical protein D9615_007548 [Tricholomella constricta]|uniref:MULE transposase domain-containing protein n=1 Tax=Tricholomella constricta TaxID=117010 RepID=A0A8H5H7N2_9AGAR|nr:hypothetical protein D9615_007548 [Tricholomella constricta]
MTATIIAPHEIIPDLTDLSPIMRELEDQYKLGRRSVLLYRRYPGSDDTSEQLCHFTKFSREILSYITSHPSFSDTLVTKLGDSAIRTSVAGFGVADYPLWKLGCLLSENWLEEDVLNSLLELLYFRISATSGELYPRFLFLPTSFFNDARYHFLQDPRLFSSNIIALRERLLATRCSAISILLCVDGHYTVYRAANTLFLEHADSLGGPPAPDMLAIIQWVMSGLDINFVIPCSIVSSAVTKQSPGSGSCGIAAMAFVEACTDVTAPLWSNVDSPVFRNKALRDLILYHFTASEKGPYYDLVVPCCRVEPSDKHQDMISPYVYTDYNIYVPLSQHPIYAFLEAVKNEPPIKFTLRTIAKEETTKYRAMTPKNNRNSPPFIIDLSSSPVRCPPRKKIKIEKILAPSQDKNPSAAATIIDLSFSSPAPVIVKAPSSPDIILVSSPVPISKVDVLDLTALPLDHGTSDDDIIAISGSLKVKEPPSFSGVPNRPLPTILGNICEGSVFSSLEEAMEAIYASEERLGHIWRKGQSKCKHGTTVLKKMTLRCNHCHQYRPVHSLSIDPSDHRAGKTIKTECPAHVNLSCRDTMWHVTKAVWEHNHKREIPPGGRIRRPPTQAQRDIVEQFSGPKFSRGHVTSILKERFPDHLLEPRQVTNMINSARKEARDHVSSLGGDAMAILDSLREKNEHEHGWRHHVRLDADQVLTGLWWQSPEQAALTQRYYDVLITDNSFNRNQYGYPLNIGIIIDNFGRSRNIWYAFHRSEDHATHTWVFQAHLDSAGRPCEVIASDMHASLISSVAQVFPLSDHVYCLHHLSGNAGLHLRPALGAEWINFQRDFWATYRAVSPEQFDILWDCLITCYPTTRQYLQAELYPCRDKWAWAWVMTKFTAGVRTNGRAEAENKTNKAIGTGKNLFLQVFHGLNQRTRDQSAQDLIRVREVNHFTHLSFK